MDPNQQPPSDNVQEADDINGQKPKRAARNGAQTLVSTVLM